MKAPWIPFLYRISLASLIGVALLSVAGCNSGTGTDSSTRVGERSPESKPDSKSIKVGIVFDAGGRGDKSFNDSAWAGVERARAELGIQEADVKSIESKNEKDFEGNITAMAEAGCEVVFAVGLGQATALSAVAPKFPDIKFAIIDSEVDQPNVRSVVFSEEEGSFLAGYLAALTSKSGKIGFVGGKKIDLITKFESGYIAGARTANPSITVLPSKYTESWDDTALGKTAAKSLFDGGADVVYHAAGRCGLGVIAAAKDAGKYAIGVDSNQDGEAPGFVLTSMIKRVDEAVFQTIRDVQSNSFTPGLRRYDLKSSGVGLSEFEFTREKIGQANLDKINSVAEKIVAGEIKVPSTTAELAAYQPTK